MKLHKNDDEEGASPFHFVRGCMSKQNKNLENKADKSLKLQTALVLESFNFRIPMPGHRSAHCIMAFKEGEEIADQHVINVLRNHPSITIVE